MIETQPHKQSKSETIDKKFNHVGPNKKTVEFTNPSEA